MMFPAQIFPHRYRFNPLPPIKEGVMWLYLLQRASVAGFNPLPPIKEGVIYSWGSKNVG